MVNYLRPLNLDAIVGIFLSLRMITIAVRKTLLHSSLVV